MAKETCDKSTPKSSDYDMIEGTPSKESDTNHRPTTCPSQNGRHSIWGLVLLAVTIGTVMSMCTRVSEQSDDSYGGTLLDSKNTHLSNYDMDFSDEYDGVDNKWTTDQLEYGYDEDNWKIAEDNWKIAEDNWKITDLDIGDYSRRHDKSGKSKSGKHSKGKSGKSDKRSKGKSGKSDKRSKGKSGKSDKRSKGKSDKRSKGKSGKHDKSKSGRHDKSKSGKHDKSKSGKHDKSKSGKENFSSSLDSSTSSESWSSSFDSEE